MSVTAMSRTFWTDFPPLSYKDKNGKQITIKNTTAKIVLLAIADNADDFGENSYQSFETLATKASVDRRSVMRVIRALVSSGFLKVAGISNYGTNNYSIILDKLGEPPKTRAKTGRPKSGDSEAKSGDSEAKSGDSEAKSGDPTSPDPSFNPPDPSSKERLDFLKTLGLDWLIASGQEVTQDMIDKAVRAKNAINDFEKVFVFGTLPWSSNSTWTKFEKFIVKIYSADPGVFKDYVSWRASDNGKYKAFSNRKIRENPQAFMDTGYPEFEASKMYAPASPQVDAAAVEATKQLIQQKDSGGFVPRPASVPDPSIVRQKLKEAAQQKGVRR